MKKLYILFMLFTSLFHAYGQTIPGFKKSCVSISFPQQAPYNQCDLEICIDQQIDCPGGVSEVVRTCSTIKPDAPGITNLNVICYVEPDNAEPACTITTLNISVTRKLSGGLEETIVCTSNASMVLDILKGNNQGYAGIGQFTIDCFGQHRILNNYFFIDRPSIGLPFFGFL